MCLGVPGQILELTDTGDITRTGKVDFGGIRKEINLAYVPDAEPGDYVIVHVGFAISRIDEDEAREIFKYIEQMDELADLET